MPIFVSYAHSDKGFATRLANQLVKHRASVWIDQWELQVGDSLLDRIQDAVQGASAMLVLLSNVASEWCKKELSSGLLRELEEKRVVVLPVLVEDCDVPIFLRGKLYADFRSDFDAGLTAVLEAVSKFTSDTLGRVDHPEWHIDWSQDWGVLNHQFLLRFTLIQHAKAQPYSVLTEVSVLANQAATARYHAFERAGFDWLQRATMLEALVNGAHDQDLRLLLEDARAKIVDVALGDSRNALIYSATISSRRLGRILDAISCSISGASCATSATRSAERSDR